MKIRIVAPDVSQPALPRDITFLNEDGEEIYGITRMDLNVTNRSVGVSLEITQSEILLNTGIIEAEIQELVDLREEVKKLRGGP